MSKVFIADLQKQPLHPGRALLLLTQDKAALSRHHLCAIILNKAVEASLPERLHLELDPGSRKTGLALLNDLSGEQGRRYLDTRRAVGRNRRQGKIRYRKPHFENSRHPASLELDHVQPLSRSGSDCVSNLVVSGRPCQRDLRDFLKGDPACRALCQRLTAFGLPGSHWHAAVGMGASTAACLSVRGVSLLQIRATGHGRWPLCLMDHCGFSHSVPGVMRRVRKFQTGDLVRTVVTRGREQGVDVGRVAVRRRVVCNITTWCGTVTDIHHRWCRLLIRGAGYTYSIEEGGAALPPSA
jgi:hypothetical protein